MKGGAPHIFEDLSRGGLSLGDGEAQNGASRPDEARRLAFKVLQPDRLFEYHCYSERGRDQGVALVRFEQWIDRDHLKFKGTNLAASDGYYD